jgi:hypothetical protein
MDIGAKFKVPMDWLLDDDSDEDFRYWEANTAPLTPPTLPSALKALGDALSEAMPADVRTDIADALAKLALRRGADRDQDQVIRLVAEGKQRETGT